MNLELTLKCMKKAAKRFSEKFHTEVLMCKGTIILKNTDHLIESLDHGRGWRCNATEVTLELP